MKNLVIDYMRRAACALRPACASFLALCARNEKGVGASLRCAEQYLTSAFVTQQLYICESICRTVHGYCMREPSWVSYLDYVAIYLPEAFNRFSSADGNTTAYVYVCMPDSALQTVYTCMPVDSNMWHISVQSFELRHVRTLRKEVIDCREDTANANAFKYARIFDSTGERTFGERV